MSKNYSSKLRKLLRKTQFKDSNKKIQSKSNITILEKKVIWSDKSALIVNDPILIKSIGGNYIIQNYLKKAPVIYDLQVKNNSIQIVGERVWEERCEGVKRLLQESKLKQIIPEEFEDLKHEKIGIPPSKKFKDYLNYIQKIFSDKALETYTKNNILLYFIENKDVRAIIG